MSALIGDRGSLTGQEEDDELAPELDGSVSKGTKTREAASSRAELAPPPASAKWPASAKQAAKASRCNAAIKQPPARSFAASASSAVRPVVCSSVDAY